MARARNLTLKINLEALILEHKFVITTAFLVVDWLLRTLMMPTLMGIENREKSLAWLAAVKATDSKHNLSMIIH